MDITLFLLYYLIFINLIGLAAFGIDKHKAVRRQWRIRESVLFAIALLGGGGGCLLGMHLFRHKTKHRSFSIGIPAVILLEISSVFCLFSLSGCQTKESPAPVALLEEQLNLIKEADSETVDQYISAETLFANSSDIESLDPDISEVFTLFFKNFDYKITGSSIQEETAEVSLNLTTIDAKALAKDFISESIVKQLQGEAAPSAVTYSLQDYYLSLHGLLTNKEYDTVSSEHTIRLVKQSEEWEIDEDQQLENILTGSFITYVGNPDLFTPEEMVALQFDTIKQFDKEQMNQFLSLDELFSADDEYKRAISKALAEQILRYLDYQITDSTDDGITAQVSMELTSCDAYSIIQNYTEQLDQYLATSEALEAGISGRLTKSNQILVDSINSNTTSATTAITLTLVNDGATWKLQMDDTMAQAILGNIGDAVAGISTTPEGSEE